MLLYTNGQQIKLSYDEQYLLGEHGAGAGALLVLICDYIVNWRWLLMRWHWCLNGDISSKILSSNT